MDKERRDTRGWRRDRRVEGRELGGRKSVAESEGEMKTERRRSDRRLRWAIRSTVLSFGSLSVSIARSELAPEEREPRNRRDRRDQRNGDRYLVVHATLNDESGTTIGLIARRSISIAKSKTGLSSWPVVLEKLSYACDTCFMMQLNEKFYSGSDWSYSRIQFEYSEEVDPSVKERLENALVSQTHVSHQYITTIYDTVRCTRVSFAIKRKTCKVFSSTVKSVGTSRVRNCSSVRVAVSLPALSTGKHVTLLRWVFQTLFSVYTRKDPNPDSCMNWPVYSCLRSTSFAKCEGNLVLILMEYYILYRHLIWNFVKKTFGIITAKNLILPFFCVRDNFYCSY